MTVEIYTLKTPAERVADRLTGSFGYKRMYRCGCSQSASWTEYGSDPHRQSTCPRCRAWRLPVEVWEQ